MNLRSSSSFNANANAKNLGQSTSQSQHVQHLQQIPVLLMNSPAVNRLQHVPNVQNYQQFQTPQLKVYNIENSLKIGFKEKPPA